MIKKIEYDMETECVKGTTAIKRFIKKFSDVELVQNLEWALQMMLEENIEVFKPYACTELKCDGGVTIRMYNDEDLWNITIIVRVEEEDKEEEVKMNKKYNVKLIMKRAHEIKREHKDNIWALCLKMAWYEAKSENTWTKERIIEDLQNKGCTIWNNKRIYIKDFLNFYEIKKHVNQWNKTSYYYDDVYLGTFKEMRWALKCAGDASLYFDLGKCEFYYGSTKGNKMSTEILNKIINSYKVL